MAFASEKDPDEAAGLSLVNGLKELNKKLRIPSLGECVKVNLEVFDQNVEKMAKDALSSGSPQNNPVVPDVQEIVELYHKAW
jgi:alcohol dehydrogenase class IV